MLIVVLNMSGLKYIKKQLFLSSLATLILISSGDTGKLSVCGPSATDDSFSSLIFVSTLDGKLSALDLAKNGEKKWTLDFDNQPLISSSIHRKELNNDGQWVRLIPSLNGGIYKFDGESLERVPISTDQLLRSSFRYSDDLIVSGSLNSQIYKVSSSTGKIQYHCKENRCTNHTEGESLLNEDVIVIQRFQQTVIASEPRTGQEKWNYSVGQHELELIPRENRGCNDEVNKLLENIEIKAIVPDGIVWAVDRNKPHIKLWSMKFDTPIVSIWRENLDETDRYSKKMKELNLFDSSQWTWGSDFTDSPGVYVGMYDRQLYVQENGDFRHLLQLPAPKTPTVFPWHPFPAVEHAVVLRDQSEIIPDHENSFLRFDDAPAVTALSVLYNSEFINGNGFYLFTKDQHENLHKCNHTAANILKLDNESIIPDSTSDEEDSGISYILSCLWHYWKEIAVLSFTTALVANLVLTQRLLSEKMTISEGLPPPVVVETHPKSTEDDEQQPNLIVEKREEFKSHYLAEFDPVDYLGKGGYGVVFEVKNKIDELHYAIKRITLPNHQESRSRVIREVKALASLDHPNIVRYYHAWLECPPTGWEDAHDELYINQSKLSSSAMTPEYSTSTKPNDDVCIDVPSSERSSMDSAREAMEANQRDDSSFIIFQSSKSGESVETEEIEDSESSSENSETTKSSRQCLKNYNNDDDDNDDKSESIVFEKASTMTKSEKDKRKASFALNLNKKSSKKSPRMFLYIQMQLCKKLSLREWLRHPSHWQDRTRVEKYFQQIVDAVEYIHLKGLIHRDLKPSNIFCAFDGKVKVGDFGLVTGAVGACNESCTPDNQCDGLHTACVGTHMYMAPEQMNGQFYNYKVDIYSLGIILFELMRPFGTEMERVRAISDLKKHIYPQDFMENHPEEYNLLRLMLDENSSKRPTTLGIKARPPLSKTTISLSQPNDDVKYHFELPQIRRHSSVNGSSSSESWENSTT